MTDAKPKSKECFKGDGSPLTGYLIAKYFVDRYAVNFFHHTCIDAESFYHIDELGFIRASSSVPSGSILKNTDKIYSLEFVRYWEKNKIKHSFHDEHEIYDMFITEMAVKLTKEKP